MIRDRDDGRSKTHKGHRGMNVEESFFYADDGVVASTNPGRPQSMFDTLNLFFKWVRMKMNFQKTVGVVCHSCRAVRVWSDKAYRRQITGAGISYK